MRNFFTNMKRSKMLIQATSLHGLEGHWHITKLIYLIIWVLFNDSWEHKSTWVLGRDDNFPYGCRPFGDWPLIGQGMGVVYPRGYKDRGDFVHVGNKEAGMGMLLSCAAKSLISPSIFPWRYNIYHISNIS